ncbi:Transposon Tf2-9 polyprotein [Dictyocoela muelleri]|nr:Transposon Tf2-9 polyprotein [Dictyocoela muelleri]
MNFSEKCLFLTEKLKLKRRINWSNKNNESLCNIFQEIRNSSHLFHPNPNEEFKLKTDASNLSFGAILTQNNKMIGLFSSKFLKSEINYTVEENETLAIIKSLDHFKGIIWLSKINILTDNKNLTYNKPLSKRIERWKMQLCEYN